MSCSLKESEEKRGNVKLGLSGIYKREAKEMHAEKYSQETRETLLLLWDRDLKKKKREAIFRT